MQVIAWLVRHSKLTQSELAGLMMVEPPTLAGILSRMEACDWVTRTQCPEDRRKNWVEVTDKVEPVWKQITECTR
jgi:MarR family transcriptional regulator for hemolysin